jgi:hypothetical protein
MKSWCCMSIRELTEIPTSRHRDDGREHAATHAPATRDMTYATHEKQLKHVIRRGRLFSEIEEWIDHTPLSEDERSALWLCAWSHGHRRVAPGWGPGPGRPEDLASANWGAPQIRATSALRGWRARVSGARSL